MCCVLILCVRGVTSQWPAGCPGRTRRRSDRIIERRGSEAAGAAHASDAEYARACHGTRARTEWHQLCAADCVTTAPTVRFYRVALHHQYTRRRRAASRRTGDRRRRPGLAGCQPATPPVQRSAGTGGMEVGGVLPSALRPRGSQREGRSREGAPDRSACPVVGRNASRRSAPRAAGDCTDALGCACMARRSCKRCDEGEYPVNLR